MGGEEARNDAGSKELWKSFIDMHEDLELLESGKCRCKVTGHEMKPLKDVVEVSAGVRGRELVAVASWFAGNGRWTDFCGCAGTSER